MKRILFLFGLIALSWGVQAQLTAPVTESFTSGSTPTSWSQSATTGGPWVFSTFNNSVNCPQAFDHTGNSGNYAWMDQSGTDAGVILEMPDVNVTSLTTPYLEFYYWMCGSGYTPPNLTYIETYNGTSWSVLDSITTATVGWQYYGYDLTGLTFGTNLVRVRFRAESGGSTSDFFGDNALDDISIIEAPTCQIPTSLSASAITSSGATLSWNSVSNALNGYEVIYGVTGFNPATAGTSSTVTANSLVISTLAGATTYDAYIIADCGTTDGISDTSSPVSFTTLCVPFTAPYSNNFDSETDGQVALCWEQYVNYSTFAYARVENLGTPRSGTQQLALYNQSGFTANDTLVAVSPEFSDLTAGDKQIRFHVKSTDDRVRLFVVTLDANTPGATPTFIDTINFSSIDTYQEIILPITTANNYNGTDTYVGFLYDLSTTAATFDYIYIDDFFYEVIPTCSKVSNLFLSAVTNTSGTIGFSNPSTAVEYEFGPTGFTQGTNAAGIVSSTANPFTISGLPANTEFDVYVRNDCGNGDVSVWEGPFTFRTLCNAINVTYTTGFENDPINSAPLCWSNKVTGSVSAYAEVRALTFTNAPFAGTQALYIYNFNASVNDTVAAISPQFSDLTAGDKRIRFQANVSSTNTELIIATTSSPLSNTYNFLDTISFSSTNTYGEIIFNFNTANGYNGTDEYIVFMHNMGQTFSYVRMDDFTYENAPACIPPLGASLGTFAVTATGASTFWGANSAGFKTYVEVGPQGFAPGVGLATVLDSTLGTVDTLAITGLNAQTDYEFYVQDSCTVDGLSPWVGPFAFTTKCLITSPITLPLNEDFESYTAGAFGPNEDFCNIGYYWSFEGGDASSRIRTTAGTAFNKSGLQAFTLDHSPSASNINTNFLILTVDLSTNTTASGIELGFSYMEHGQEANSDNMVWVRGAPTDPWIQIYDLELNSAGNGTYNDVSQLDIVAPITAAGQSIGALTQIRFGQSGRFSASSINFSDGYTFDDLSLQAVSCPTPSGLNTATLVDTAANLAWNATAGASSYDVWFGPQGFYQGTQTTSGFRSTQAGTTLLVDTLLPNMCYEFAVRTNCGANDSSNWAGPFVFCTPCSPFSAPYFQDWDGVSTGKDLDCYKAIEDPSFASSAFSGINIVTFGSPFSTPNQIEMDNSSSPLPLMLVSPPTTDLTVGDKRLKFNARMSFATTPASTLVVGTMSVPSDASTFNPIDTIVLDATIPAAEYRVDLTAASGYNGTDIHYALAHGQDATFRTIYIDDILYETIPTCPEPFVGADAGAFSIDTLSAEIYWTAGGTSTADYQVEYGTGSFGSSGNTRIIATNDTASIANLMDATDYCFWVRQICAVGDSSAWAGPTCFTTTCRAIAAPYTENWDGLSAGLDLGCFLKIEDPSFATNAFNGITIQNSTFNQPVSTPNLVEFDNAGVLTSPLILISPLTKDLVAGDKRIRFFARSNSVFNLRTLIVGTLSDPSDAATFNPLDTFTMTIGMVEYTTEFSTANGYNGTDAYFAIAHGQNSTFQTIFVDDILYETTPTCAPRPSGVSAYGIGASSLSFTWTGGKSTSTNFVVQYGTSGVLNDPSNTIVALSNDSLDITSLTSNTNYCAWVAEICTPGDTSIWEGPVCATTACLPLTAPFVEDFSGNTVGHWDGANNCWDFRSNNPETSSSGGYSWEVRNTAQTTSGTGTGPDRDATLWPAIGGTFITADVSGSTTAGPDSTLLVSPIIDISGLNNPEFQYALHRHGSNMAELHVDIYDGTNWVRGVHSYTSLAGIQSAPGDDWKDTTASLSAYAGTTNLRVRFRSVTNGCCAGDNAIDDVRISDPIACPAPSGFTSMAITSTSAEVSWDTTGLGSATFEVEYGITGFTPGSGTLVAGLTGVDYTITGLNTVNVCQDVYLRTLCASGDTSLWTGPISACPIAVPCDSLDQYQANVLIDDGQSALFIPWVGAAGKGEISNTRSFSGANSLHIEGAGTATDFSDVVAYFDDYTSGIWDISFKMYVETGKGGYYNIQEDHDPTGTGTNLWAGDVYFGSNGTATVQYANPAVVVGTFSYTQGQWIDINTVMDLDNDTVWVEYNGTSTGLGWVLSAVNAATTAPMFNGVNFYTGPLTAGAYTLDYYVDDFCVSPRAVAGVCLQPSALAPTTNIGCDSLEVSWTSNSGSSIVEYGAVGFAPGTGTLSGVITTSTFGINGLMPGTAYDFYVADTCAGGDTSAFIGPITVTTATGPLPVASFITTSINGFVVSFDGSASTGGGLSYTWDFGDGTTGTGATPSHTYTTGGSFNIQLKVTNGCGADSTTSGINSVSIGENPLAQTVTVYPNPTSGVVNVRFNSFGNASGTIRILELSGKEVLRLQEDNINGEYSGQVDISNLATGVYMLEISSGDLKATRRLIKN